MSNLLINKRKRQTQRQNRVRSVLFGTAVRPRLSVFRSLKHISAQLIDDASSKTLASATDFEIKGKKTKTEVAMAVGELLAAKAADKKITEAIFDRGPNKYHGRVKAVAEGARQGGLKF